jgi:predicted methyltransferase
MDLQLQIPELVLQKLLKSGLIHPSEIICLNNESRDSIKSLCLNFCQPQSCRTCDMQNHCAERVYDVSGVIDSIDILKAKGLNS